MYAVITEFSRVNLSGHGQVVYINHVCLAKHTCTFTCYYLYHCIAQ